jgi:hypothetical protein
MSPVRGFSLISDCTVISPIPCHLTRFSLFFGHPST